MILYSIKYKEPSCILFESRRHARNEIHGVCIHNTSFRKIIDYSGNLLY